MDPRENCQEKSMTRMKLEATRLETKRAKTEEILIENSGENPWARSSEDHQKTLG
jgi:hypothetical protein